MKRRRSASALSSAHLRRPLQRCFPLFMLPVVAAFAIGFVWPFLQGIFLSFTKFKTTSNWKWVGIDNYIKAFGDESFRYSFSYTAVFAVISLVLINVLAFAVAYALTQKIRGANLFRTVFFMPNLIGGIVLGWIWNLLLTGILAKFGKTLVHSEAYGFWGLTALMLWQQAGYMMVIYISGLQSIPDDLIEAAAIDGATPLQTLFRIKIPMVMPSVTICTFLTLTNSFKLFDQNMVLNGGQPFVFRPDGTIIKSTEMLALNIYNTFYLNSNSRGVGQAKAVLFFILVAAIALVQLRATHTKEVQQ